MTDIVDRLEFRAENLFGDVRHHARDLDLEAAAEIRALRCRIQELEDGSCRFNCRSVKEAFHSGYLAGQCGENSLEAYEGWRNRE